MTISLVFGLERLMTPCGELLVVTDSEGVLRALDWSDCESRMHGLLRLHYGRDAVQRVVRRPTSGGVAPGWRGPHAGSDVRRAIEAYFEGDLEPIAAIPVRTGGTPFQREVWAALRGIPAGRTVTYRALATELSRPRAMRAVGMANGANPISLVVPCHRVIGTDGSLTGYAGGLARKRWLLEHEGVRLSDARRAA